MTDYQPHIISPVLDDLFLPKGLLPFTEFGAYPFSDTDPRVFKQTEYWVTPDGTPERLDEYTVDELEDLLMYLNQYPMIFYHDAKLYEALFLTLEVTEGREEPIKALTYSYEESLNLPHIEDYTAGEWLANTILYRSIIDRIDAKIS